jgi:hypothetical protein
MMNQEIDFYVPERDEFLQGCSEYERREDRGGAYFRATSTITDGWGDPTEMAAGVEVIIRGWSSRYSGYDRKDVLSCIERNLPTLNTFRKRQISSFVDEDTDPIKSLFNEFLDALKIYRRGTGYVKSPVSVAKAINPLAPDFFPLWDQAISEAYRCGYSGYGPENAANIYLRFCVKMKMLACVVKAYVGQEDDRSILKRIDEYNYAKYTKSWI